MKPILKKSVLAVLFAAILVSLHAALSYFYHFPVGQDAESVGRVQAIARSTSPCSILFMGDSYLMMAANLDLFPDSALANSLGEPYLVTFYKLRYLLNVRRESPRLVILQLDKRSFAEDGVGNTENYGWAPWVDYWEVARYRHSYWPTFSAWVMYKAFPYAGKADEFTSYMLHNPEPDRKAKEALFHRRADQEKNLESIAIRRASESFLYHRWDQPEPTYYLHRIFNLCRARKVPIVLVEMPVTRPFDNAEQQFVSPAQWQQKTEEIRREFPEVTLVDLHDRFFDRLDLFMDVNHLNDRGRDLFSVCLREELERRGLLPSTETSLSKMRSGKS